MPRCDEETLHRAVQRRHEAPDASFETFYDCFAGQIRALFTRFGRSPEEVLDLTQETFLRLYDRGLAAFRGESVGEFVAYLQTIARNLVFKKARRDDKEPRLLADLTAQDEERPESDEPADLSNPSPQDDAERREKARLFREAIDALSPRRRQCVVLRVVQGLSYEEIGKIMQISPNTVGATLNQAKKALEETLQGHVDPEELTF